MSHSTKSEPKQPSDANRALDLIIYILGGAGLTVIAVCFLLLT